MFGKVLIANRGEIAVRIIRTCQTLDIRTVAVYSSADVATLHTTLADEAVFIGSAPSSESYLHQNAIIEAALKSGCEAVHPGYGFLAENADFAESVMAAGLIFIGPKPDSIRLMGSKTAARSAMQAAGVPVLPGYHPLAETTDEAILDSAGTIGFPVLVKAVAGGGGKGMRLANSAQTLLEAVQSARREALNAFGNADIYLEKYIPAPHHIEIQIFGDSQGNLVHMFERDCSVQRRHQKIIEESPSPFIDEALRQRMGAAAVAAGRAVNYVNAGTIEFLMSDKQDFYFLEMNTRLQVEHPVTEMITGIDLVKLQLTVAAGEVLPFDQEMLTRRGHAIECRIYAEDPAGGFVPDTGPIVQVVEPQGPGIRVDSGITTGDEVTHYYDPLLAKLIILGEDRSDALRKMTWALRQYIIFGIRTNIRFLGDVITHPDFSNGEPTTDFIERYFTGWQPDNEAPSDLILVAAALSDMLAQKSDRMGDAITAETDPYSPWSRLGPFRMGAMNPAEIRPDKK